METPGSSVPLLVHIDPVNVDSLIGWERLVVCADRRHLSFIEPWWNPLGNELSTLDVVVQKPADHLRCFDQQLPEAPGVEFAE